MIDRMGVHWKLPHHLNRRYEYDFKEHSHEKKALIVTFSPGRGYAFYKKSFKHDTLYIRSKGCSYYTMQAGRLADNIKYISIWENGLKVSERDDPP